MPVSVSEPHVAAAIRAVQTGDVEGLAAMLEEHPALATDRFERRLGTLTLLHVTGDWPGYFPRAPEAVRLLGRLGADPDALTEGPGSPETPLHWAASSDDVDVAEALLDLGARLEAPGGSIGTPLDNAVGYGCWHTARLLVARGARVGGLWQAAGLGLTDLVEELLDADPPPSQDDVDHAFWQACHGGQRRTAELLLARGARIDAAPFHSDRTPLDIAGSLDTRKDTLVAWLREQGAHGADA